jgi:Dolichyl-phosphate-mannose-protein mannosyltransferase
MAIPSRRSGRWLGVRRDGPSSGGGAGAARQEGREEARQEGLAAGLVAAGQSETGASAAAPPPSAGPFDRRVIGVGGVVFAVLMALSARYGYHRDELYFLDSARHLQASYVDQPLLAPLLARVSLSLFGLSLPGLHVWPALAAWGAVVVSGLTAREFGGGRRAQLLAAVGTATMPVLLAGAHVANTTAYEFLAWAGLALIVARIGRTGDCRWWLAGGLVAGLGVADDHSAGLFALALVIGALLSGGRALILNRWFAAGTAISLAFEVPDIWWQAQHQWATIAMTHALSQEHGGLGNISTWVIGQLGLVTLALAWVWVAGLRFLWRSGRPLWRALAWAYGLLFVLFALTAGARTYYLAAAYVYLLAAGAVAIDGWLQARPGRVRKLVLAITLTTAASLPIILPLLPPADIGWTYKTNQTLGETVGWPQLVRTVRSPSAGTTPTGGGDRATRAPLRWWPSHQVPSMSPATPLTSGSSSPLCGRRPPCRIRTASATRNGAATSTCALAPATRGVSYGHGCATTTDSGTRRRAPVRHLSPRRRRPAGRPASGSRSRRYPGRLRPWRSWGGQAGRGSR